MKLSDRLMKIADLVAKGASVADIGTDHGYIPVYLVKNKIANKVIASDVSYDSLKKASSYVKENNLDHMIDTRLGDGLKVLKAAEVDTVIIAGMGGLLIQDILEKDREITDSITHFILQPMVASRELRQFLYDNGFTIINESLAKETSRFYEIIYATKGLDKIESPWDLLINPILIKNKHPLLQEFIVSRLDNLETIKNELKASRSKKSQERVIEIDSHLSFYREVLKKVEG